MRYPYCCTSAPLFCRELCSRPMLVHRPCPCSEELSIFTMRSILTLILMCSASLGCFAHELPLFNCEEYICLVLFVSRSRADESNQRGTPRLQNFVLGRQPQPAVSSEDCTNSALSRVQSHLLPHWHRSRDRVFKLILPELLSLRGQTRKLETFAHTR